MSEGDWTKYSRYVSERALEEMRRKKITQAGLGEIMGRSQQYVSRMLSGRENLTLESLSLLDASLGLNISRGLLNDVAEDKPTDFYSSSISSATFGEGSSLKVTDSADAVIRYYETGDRPFLVKCSDSSRYLCKAAKYEGSTYNLARELIGTSLANIFGICDSQLALIRLLPGHVTKNDGYDMSVPVLGRKWIDDMTDIKDKHVSDLQIDASAVLKLMKIALFDIWACNEDRLNNNLNLLYSFKDGRIEPIDHAGIFNTGFDVPLMELSTLDSMMYSNLFVESYRKFPPSDEDFGNLEAWFSDKVNESGLSAGTIWNRIPTRWGIAKERFDSLIGYITSPDWQNRAFKNFREILNDSTR